MAGTFSKTRAASILAEAEFFDDRKVAKRWKISERTICNYRARLAEDKELADLFQAKKQELAGKWREDCSKTLTIALAALQELLPKAQTEEHCKLVYSLSGAIKILGDLAITSTAVLDDPAAK